MLRPEVCDDQSSSLFSEAKSAFQQATGADSSQDFEEEDVQRHWPELYNDMARHGLPDMYYAGRFQMKGRRAVGIGRDKQHRKRAACLGIAMLCKRDWEDPKFQSVQSEVFNTSCWFPIHVFEDFCDINREQFWQNIESWRCDGYCFCSCTTCSDCSFVRTIVCCTSPKIISL